VTSSSSTESQFTASDGRRFAFPVGTAFFVLSAVLWWRERPTPMSVMIALGGALYVAGALVPARLGPLYRSWMRLAHLISKVTTPIFMGVVYFLVLTPTGVVMRLFGRRPMKHQPTPEGGFWHRVPEEHRGDLTRQF
jgi:hypothetical protein